MDLVNSRNVNNRIKKNSIVIAVIFHFVLGILTFGLSLVLLATVGTATLLLLNKDMVKAKSRNHYFNKSYPFGSFGVTFGRFQHVFHHSYSIEKDIYAAIEKALKDKTPITFVKTVPIIDTDPGLKNCEQRSFINAQLEPTSRGTAITLTLNQSNFGSMRTIQWRILAGGYVDKNSQFNLMAYSLFTVFSWISPYLKGEADLLSRVRTIYPGTYNYMDVETQIRCLHEVVFDTTISELKKNGIDTAELKLHKIRTVNSNISDEKINFVNFPQRAQSTVADTVKAARA